MAKKLFIRECNAKVLKVVSEIVSIDTKYCNVKYMCMVMYYEKYITISEKRKQIVFTLIYSL